MSTSNQLEWWMVGAVLGGAAAIVLLLWVISRFVPNQHRTAAGNALMSAEVFFNPSRRHIMEAREHEEREDDDSGEPPKT